MLSLNNSSFSSMGNIGNNSGNLLSIFFTFMFLLTAVTYHQHSKRRNSNLLGTMKVNNNDSSRLRLPSPSPETEAESQTDLLLQEENLNILPIDLLTGYCRLLLISRIFASSETSQLAVNQPIAPDSRFYILKVSNSYFCSFKVEILRAFTVFSSTKTISPSY